MQVYECMAMPLEVMAYVRILVHKVNSCVETDRVTLINPIKRQLNYVAMSLLDKLQREIHCKTIPCV